MGHCIRRIMETGSMRMNKKKKKKKVMDYGGELFRIENWLPD